VYSDPIYHLADPPPPVAGYANIHHDRYLFANERPVHDLRYGDQYRGHPHMALVNRNDRLWRFVELNFLTRNGVIHNTPDIVHIETGSNHAFNVSAAAVPAWYQGSFIFVNGIAEEGRFSDHPALYGEAQFAGVLAWATAHELSHMIGVEDSSTPGSLMGSTTGTVINDVSFIDSEIQQINLRARLSVEN